MDRVSELKNKMFNVIDKNFEEMVKLKDNKQNDSSISSEQCAKYQALGEELTKNSSLIYNTINDMIDSFKNDDTKDSISSMLDKIIEIFADNYTWNEDEINYIISVCEAQLEEDEFLRYEDEFDAIAQREEILADYIDNCYDYDTDELNNELNCNQVGNDLGTDNSGSDSDDLDNANNKKANLKSIIIAAAIGTVMIAGTIVGVVKLKGNKNYKIEKDGLSSQTTNVVIDDSSKHEDSSLKEEIEEEVSSLIESKLDEDSKIEEKEDDSKQDDAKKDDTKKDEESSKKDETVIKTEDSKVDEYPAISDDNYYVAPDGSVWASEEDYNAYNEYEQNGTYSEDGYYVAPDGTIWVDEETYNEYSQYEEQSGYYTAPDGTIWESEEDYNLYMEYNDVNENVKVK